MRNLDPGTYADLKADRRLVVAIPRCRACAPQGFAGEDHTKAHNERCAAFGERAYPLPQFQRRAA